jgi:hypothetical protein
MQIESRYVNVNKVTRGVSEKITQFFLSKLHFAFITEQTLPKIWATWFFSKKTAQSKHSPEMKKLPYVATLTA